MAKTQLFYASLVYHVRLQLRRLGKGIVTQFARIWLLPRVYPHVASQRTALRKPLLAHGTRVGFSIGRRPFVCLLALPQEEHAIDDKRVGLAGAGRGGSGVVIWRKPTQTKQ